MVVQRTSQQPGPASGSLPRKISRTFSKAVEDVGQTVEEITSFLEVDHSAHSQGECDGQEVQTDTATTRPPGPTAAQAASLSAGLLDHKKILRRDTTTFFFGVVNVALVAYWVGASPTTYKNYWLFKCFALFFLRWLTYKRKGQHYLMLELCYAGNAVGAVHLFVYPHIAWLRKLAFATMSGPLMFSILAMRNSLVFHSLDKVTTLMMHASPAIVAWCMRWHPDPAWTAGMSAGEVQRYTTASWLDMLGPSIAFYMAWVMSYYILTFVLLKDRIQGRGRINMYELMVPKDPQKVKRSALARMVVKAPPSLRPFVYLACHGFAATLAFLPTRLFWLHQWLHTTALLLCLAMAVWNGGSYYFVVFSRKYLLQLEDEAAGRAVRGTSDKEQ